VIGGLVSDAARDADPGGELPGSSHRPQACRARHHGEPGSVARGARSDVDAAVLIDTLVGPLYLRLLITG